MLTVRFMDSPSYTALIVDGLPLSMTADDLQRKFQPFGKVIWARVVIRYGRSLGYAYVVMANKIDAEKALNALNGQSLGYRPLTVAMTVMPPLPHV